jgi:cell division protein FtsB
MRYFFYRNLVGENMALTYTVTQLQKEIQTLKEKNKELDSEIVKKNGILSILMEKYDVSPHSAPF